VIENEQNILLHCFNEGFLNVTRRRGDCRRLMSYISW